jgi:hypothetical protein
MGYSDFIRGQDPRTPHPPYRTMNELNALFAEIDAAAEAYGQSIERGFALANEIAGVADEIDAGYGDARAEIAEWV